MFNWIRSWFKKKPKKELKELKQTINVILGYEVEITANLNPDTHELGIECSVGLDHHQYSSLAPELLATMPYSERIDYIRGLANNPIQPKYAVMPKPNGESVVFQIPDDHRIALHAAQILVDMGLPISTLMVAPKQVVSPSIPTEEPPTNDLTGIEL